MKKIVLFFETVFFAIRDIVDSLVSEDALVFLVGLALMGLGFAIAIETEEWTVIQWLEVPLYTGTGALIIRESFWR